MSAFSFGSCDDHLNIFAIVDVMEKKGEFNWSCYTRADRTTLASPLVIIHPNIASSATVFDVFLRTIYKLFLRETFCLHPIRHKHAINNEILVCEWLI